MESKPNLQSAVRRLHFGVPWKPEQNLSISEKSTDQLRLSAGRSHVHIPDRTSPEAAEATEKNSAAATAGPSRKQDPRGFDSMGNSFTVNE
jgi:hypothetical protein